MRANSEIEKETRVWLWISENKVLVGRLQELLNKRVEVRGELHQMPENIHSGRAAIGNVLEEIGNRLKRFPTHS